MSSEIQLLPATGIINLGGLAKLMKSTPGHTLNALKKRGIPVYDINGKRETHLVKIEDLVGHETLA